ncbi:MAG TPA: PaaI family thioesterase [Pseudonocardia sp.]|jgi:acyl-coenzyme A thioesterase PaaI-like protein|nr:PaaI family thioesterase [Pseudonocardia sp.]
MTTEDQANLADEWNRTVAALVPRIPDLGIETLELRRGYVRARASLATNGNHLGSMYAGTLFGMAEMLGGALAWPEFDFSVYLPTVKDLTINYRRPALSDITATAGLETQILDRMRREAAETGRTQYEVDAVLTDGSGDVVARTRGTYLVIALTPPGGG